MMTRPVVYTYQAAESGLLVNSYLVEGESGIVVVDTNLLVSDIAALRARLRALKKPLRAILITHAHPDHFNGALALVREADHDVPVYATKAVATAIEQIADAKRAQWSPVYGDEWPAETYYPNSPLADGAQVQLDEMSFTVREVGPAESHADSYLVLTANEGAIIAFTAPPTATPAAGWPPWTPSAPTSQTSARSTPATAPQPAQICSPSSAATCCTTASSSAAWPPAKTSSRTRPSPSSTPRCGPSCQTPR